MAVTSAGKKSRWVRLAFTAAVICLAVSLPVRAAGCLDQEHADAVRKRIDNSVEHPRRIAVETCDGRRLQGSVSEAGTDTFVLTNDGRSTTVTFADVRRVIVRRRTPRTVTALIVAAVVAGSLLAAVYLLGGLRG
jgi:hypothetical protein